MGVLEEQNRRLQSERDSLAEGHARQTAELERQAKLLADARAASEVAQQDHARLTAERDALIAERDAKAQAASDAS